MSPRVIRRSVVLAILAVALVACEALTETPPAPTPADFPGIATALAAHGISVGDFVSGEAGCTDADLTPTAIRFRSSGLDQAEPTTLYIYIFRNRESYDRLRGRVDECARAYVTDPEAYGSVEASPYVVAGPGPWAPEFAAALREALVQAAGTGD